MTSLMFLILLGIATCNEICYKKSTGICPETATKTITSSETDLVKEIKAGTTIYTDTTLVATLTDKNINNVIAVINLLDTNAGVTVTLAASVTTPSLTLSGIDLTVTPPSSSPASKLMGDEKLTCTSLILNKESTVVANTAIAINDLTCTSIKAGKNAILLTTGSVTIVGDDVIAKVSIAASKVVTLTDDASATTTVELPAKIKVNVTSFVTIAAATFGVDGAFDTLENYLSISLNYGNAGKTILTISAETGTKASAKPFVTVNTYYKLADSVTDAMKPIFTLGKGYGVDKDDNRLTVPVSSKYCLDQAGSKSDKCPTGSQVLWNDKELAKVKFDMTLIEIYLSGYTGSNSLTLELDAYKDKAVKLAGADRDANTQLVKLNSKIKDETVTGNLQFDNVKVTVVVPVKSTAATLKFNTLFARKTNIDSEEASAAPSPVSSKILRAAVPITVSADDLASDVDSYVALKFNTKETKPKKLAIIGAETATFAADGKSVTIGTAKLTDDIIPLPVTLAFIPGEKQEIDLTIEAAAKGNPTALPFSIDVQPGVTLDAKYKGEWSGNKIVVNVPEGASFIGTTTKGEGNSAPTMEASGEGKAQLDGKDIPKPEPPAGTPTPKGGLSGGAIAGIVIACVVVVAAVVVVVVVVIKKKKGKVAN